MTPALLVENIHPDAIEPLKAAGVSPILSLPKALDGADLTRRLRDQALLGIRSRTQVTAAHIADNPQLLAVGCFCIGTNQVDIGAAEAAGVPVFNAPFANARSVAELAIASAIHLMRRIPEKAAAAKRGEWLKSADGAFEVRAKKLGIVGYGNIGSQLSVIASALGMHVYYYDIEARLRHGNARPMGSLAELLETCEIITLHVPSTPATAGMIGREALARMQPGAVLINYARGDLVDLEALAEALASGRLAGAAIDVFPEEPSSPNERFVSALQRFDNVILTPHIGGSTQEAQAAIGREVAEKLAAYVTEGATTKAVNFPEVALPPRRPGRIRIAHIHSNTPGVLAALNEAFSKAGLNIAGQALATTGAVGYVLADLEGAPPPDLALRVAAAPGTIRVRILGA